MEEENKRIELRRYPRISWGFMVKIKPYNSPDAKWEISTIKNISQGGCYFYSNINYEVGQILEMQIQFPALKDPVSFAGQVKRCEFKQDQRYGLGIYFLEIDHAKKQEFINTMDFFLKKQSK